MEGSAGGWDSLSCFPLQKWKCIRCLDEHLPDKLPDQQHWVCGVLGRSSAGRWRAAWRVMRICTREGQDALLLNFFVMVNNDPQWCSKSGGRRQHDDAFPIALTLTVSLSVRTPNLYPGLLNPTSPRSHGWLIERPRPSDCSVAGLTRWRRRTIKRRSCPRGLAPRLSQCLRVLCVSRVYPDLTLRVDVHMQCDGASRGKSTCMCARRWLQTLLTTADCRKKSSPDVGPAQANMVSPVHADRLTVRCAGSSISKKRLI